MYVEFHAYIAPHLNKGGKYSCEIDNVTTYCTTFSSLVYERRIAILINKDLDPNNTTPFKIKIIGVALPDSIPAHKKIFVAFSPAG